MLKDTKVLGEPESCYHSPVSVFEYVRLGGVC